MTIQEEAVRMRRALVMLVLVVLGPALVACGTDSGGGDSTVDDSSVDDSAAGSPAVPGDDSTPMQPPSGPYTVTSLDVDGQKHEPVPGTTIRLEFTGGQVRVDAGCNHLMADYAFDGTAVTITQVGGTEMGCEQPRMAQDDLLGEVLPGSWTVEGSEVLLLSADGKQMELTPIVETDQPLVGTKWRLTSILDGDTASSVPQGAKATLSFDEEGNIGVNDGCNTGGGEVEVSGSTITIGNLISTQMACVDPARRTTQDAYDRVLKGKVEFVVEGDTLILTKGKAGLEFTAR